MKLTKREMDAFKKDFHFNEIFMMSNKIPSYDEIGISEEDLSCLNIDEKKMFYFKEIWVKNKLFRLCDIRIKRVLFRMMMDLNPTDCIEMLQETYNYLFTKKNVIKITGKIDKQTIEAINHSTLLSRLCVMLTIRYLCLYVTDTKKQYDLMKYFNVSVV